MSNYSFNFAASPRPPASSPSHADLLYSAAALLALDLAVGRRLSHDVLRRAMSQSFGEDETGGKWVWRDAYDAAETASYILIRRYWKALSNFAQDPPLLIDRLDRIQMLMPSQTKRSEEQIDLQQFSTPLAMAFALSLAAKFKPGMTVLEPSAGTGSLALWASLNGAMLTLNEIGDTRHGLLRQAFPNCPLYKHNAANIHGYMAQQPFVDCVIMNPPFSADVALPGRRSSSVTFDHVSAAWQRLKDGGRLISVTYATTVATELAKSLDNATIRSSIEVSGKLYQKYGGHIPTAIHVFDKNIDSASNPTPICVTRIDEIAEALHALADPQPRATDNLLARTLKPASQPRSANLIPFTPSIAALKDQDDIIDVEYDPVTQSIETTQTDAIYTPWQPISIVIKDAQDHPTPLAESTAMAAIKLPVPSYRPKLPQGLISERILSNAQIESVIYAGEAHSAFLPNWFTIDDNQGTDNLKSAKPGADDAFQLRQGWFLGDGTGAGKGRQVAAIILDNFLKGRRRAVWVSKSAELFEDAVRDWTALKQPETTLFALADYGQGQNIPNRDGILFTTYATLRRAATQTKPSRLEQITNWLGADFEGAIVFDESHALSGAAGGEAAFIGNRKSTQQGRAGLSIQNLLPKARIVYVSATGASSLHALAYANRLGLWAQDLFPFANRDQFIASMEAGGVAAIEVVARDLKALGLYMARNLSYDGVEIEVLTHDLTPPQIDIYDKYAEGFQIIHANINKALQSTCIESETGSTYCSQSKSNSWSAFEGAKQRFFSHILTSMKCPSLFAAIDRDIEAGHAVIIQIVSTGEATLTRALESIPLSQHQDLNTDITPRDTVLHYLHHSFPVQLHQVQLDAGGHKISVPIFDENKQPVLDPKAVAARNALIENLLILPPIPTALDQIIWRYGEDNVAEITGRSRRIVKSDDGKLQVHRRHMHANTSETDSFMNDKKRILIFSDAGGTGRSYHADKDKPNNRRRIHYLLEPGWRADAAIQGLGRSNRTNQSIAPVFRPVTTNVKGEKRFIATIAKRLDTLGAITRGQKNTASQGMFREEDNFESDYAKSGLYFFCKKLAADRIPSCSHEQFKAMTGLSLDAKGKGKSKSDTPPMHRFLNRMLGLQISVQNDLFEHLEELISAFITQAKEEGRYQLGVETINADSIEVLEDQPIKLAIAVREETRLLTIRQTDPLAYLSFEQALAKAVQTPPYTLVMNARSGEVAIQTPTNSTSTDQGEIIKRVRLIKPHHSDYMKQAEYEASHWREAHADGFKIKWNEKIAALPTTSQQTYFILTGLLLPLWDRLPPSSPQIKRIITNDGQVLLGRKLDTKDRNEFAKKIDIALIKRDPQDIWNELQSRHAAIQLIDDIELKNVTFANITRVEINIRLGGHAQWLKQIGCIIEIQSYQSRIFVPDITILARILDKFPEA